MEAGTDRGVPCAMCLYGDKKAYKARSLKLSDVKVICMDSWERRVFVVEGRNAGVIV